MRFLRRSGAVAAVAAIAAALTSTQTHAQNTLKIGVVLPMTGPLAFVGRQAYEGAKLYLAQRGYTIAGQKVEVFLTDDGSAPDKTVAAAQRLIEQDKVAFLGVGSTGSAVALAPLVTKYKIATAVMASAVTGINEASPYFVRTSYTLGQQSRILAEWLVKNGSKNAAMIQLDWPSGAEAGATFGLSFAEGGGKIVENVRVPLATNDFVPYLQKVRASKPDALFAYVLAQQAPLLAAQFKNLGLDKEGIKLVGVGELTDEGILSGAGETLLGAVTAGVYSALHESSANKEFVTAFQKATNSRPNAIAAAGYDAMALLSEALKKTGGKSDGDALIEAIKGMKWESVRGPVVIDAKTRDIIQDIYMRRVERAQDGFYNVEFQTYRSVSSQPPACCVSQACSDMRICGRAAP